MDFKEARKFVHSLKLSNQEAWFEFSKSKSKPKNIPGHPHIIYKDNGWKGYGDWLRPKIKIPKNPDSTYGDKWTSWGDFLEQDLLQINTKLFLSFEEARKYVRSLNLNTVNEWRKYKNKLPPNIPKNLNHITRKKVGKVIRISLDLNHVNPKQDYIDFSELKSFVKSKNIKTMKEWLEFWNKK